MGRHAVIGLALRNPLYKEVKRKITESLRRGEWRPSEAIPSEKKLGERFGVSMGTVRKAVDQILSIPMKEGVESLNVAVASALCAFEALRAGRLGG